MKMKAVLGCLVCDCELKSLLYPLLCISASDSAEVFVHNRYPNMKLGGGAYTYFEPLTPDDTENLSIITIKRFRFGEVAVHRVSPKVKPSKQLRTQSAVCFPEPAERG